MDKFLAKWKRKSVEVDDGEDVETAGASSSRSYEVTVDHDDAGSLDQAGTSASTDTSGTPGGKSSRETETRKGKKLKTSSSSTYEEKRKRSFLSSWAKDYPWLRNDEQKSIMYCAWCRQFPDLVDKNSPLFKGTGPGASKPSDYRKGGLITHDKRANHQRVAGKRTAINNPGNQPMDIHLANLSNEEKNRMRILFNTAHFTAKEDLAMKKYPKLCNLQERNGLDLGNNYRNDKSCRQFIDAIADESREILTDEINETRFICVLGDGTTDRGVIEQEAVYVRYVDKDNTVKTTMVDCVALEKGDADGVLKGIDEGLNTIGVTEQMQMDKMVACNFDGAAVNMGKHNRVAKKLKDWIDDHIVVVHCTCIAHNLELAILDVMHEKGQHMVEDLESTLRGVYNFYHLSPKRRRGLTTLAEVLEEDEPYYMYSSVKTVRWLASRHRAITAVEKY